MKHSPKRNQRVLIVGGNSTIGSELYKVLSSQGFIVDVTTRKESNISSNYYFLDLTDKKSFNSISNHYYNTAIICSAITSIAECDKDPSFSYIVNVDAIIDIIDRLSDLGTHVIFISTSLVFDGSIAFPGPLNRKNPLCHYAEQKSIVEDYLLANYLSATIIRFSKVIPPKYPLFADWISSLTLGKPIYPFKDKNLSPVTLSYTVLILAWLVKHRQSGLYQVSSKSEITYLDAALYLAELKCLDTSLVIPTRSFSCAISDGIDNKPLFSTLQFSPQLSVVFSIPSPYYAIRESLK